jgi:Arc/MetJ family transcription regulator
MAGNGSQQLFAPQLAAAAVAVATGVYLWRTLHEGSFGTTEQLLAAGAAAAIIALAIQATAVGSALRRLRKSGGDNAKARSRIAMGYRGAAILLAVAVLTMAASHYA